MQVSCGILHRNDEGIFDSLKNMAIITKIEHRGQTVKENVQKISKSAPKTKVLQIN